MDPRLQPASTPPPQSTTPGLHSRKHSPDVATPSEVSDLRLPRRLLLIYRPRKDERLSWPGWLACSGSFTHVSGHPSAAGRAQNSESTSAEDRRSTTQRLVDLMNTNLDRHRCVQNNTALKCDTKPEITQIGSCALNKWTVKRSGLVFWAILYFLEYMLRVCAGAIYS